jgi:hypothetical protein
LRLGRRLQPGFFQEAFALRLIVVAARIKSHGLIRIVIGNLVGTGQIFHAIFEIGLGIEQIAGAALMAHAARGCRQHLHQTPIGTVAGCGIKPAFTLYDAAYQRFRHSIGNRIFRYQTVERPVA